jgi:anti-sigma factor RsiW
MNDAWTERLSEYLDGGLRDAEREELEEHLASCDGCTDALEGLRRVVTTAQDLPDVPPATDLWPAIAAQITPPESGREPAREPRRSPFWRLRFSFSVPQLAAAGIAVFLVSVTAAWWMASSLAPDTDYLSLGGPATSESVLAASNRAYVEFGQEVNSLKRLLVEEGDKLDPETVRVIEKNLKIIEAAIAQSRLALDTDPANSDVQRHLVATMGGKVKMLRRAADVALASAEGI